MAIEALATVTFKAGGLVTVDKSITLDITIPDVNESESIPIAFPLNITEVETIAVSLSVVQKPPNPPAATPAVLPHGLTTFGAAVAA